MKLTRKILVVIPSLQFWWWAERVASIIGSELGKKWNQVTFFTFYDVPNKYHYEWNYISLKERNSNNILIKVVKLTSRAFQIAKFCKINKVDTIISFMEDANFPVILGKILLFNKATLIISIRYSIYNYAKGIYHYLIKLLYPKADKIVTLTNHEKNNLISNYWINTEKVCIIHNPIDINKIEKLKIEPLDKFSQLFNKQKFTFVTAWRLTGIKNQQMLIEAFIKLNKEYPETQLIILWDWELKTHLQDIAKWNTDIHFLGNQQNVYKFFNNSNCFVLPSLTEAFPNVIIEAMSCGLPVISTMNQWAFEILWDNSGLLVDNNNFTKLYEAIKTMLLNKTLISNYQKKSLNKIKEYEIGLIVKKWIDIL